MKTIKSSEPFRLSNGGKRFLFLIISIALFFAFALIADGQNLTSSEKGDETKDTLKSNASVWEGLSITFLTGETSLTKGNTLSVAWKKGKSVLITDINDELGEFMYLYYPKKWFSIGPSVGFLRGIPYFGPIGTLEWYKDNFSFKTLDWFGWDFGNSINKCSFLFSYHQITLGYNFNNKFLPEAYYVLQHFQKNLPEHLFGTKVTFGLNSTWSVFGGWAYMLREDYHLWSCGINFNI